MIKRYLFILSSLLFLAGIFFVALNNNAIGVSLYCAGGKECAPTFAFEESGDQTKYKPAEPNKYCNSGQCGTKWLKQGDLPPGKNGFCLGGVCLKSFIYPAQQLPTPGLNFTINGQKGVVWIPAESDIQLKWNISPPAQEVSLSCTGDCPELNDINNGIKTAYARRGTVSVNWNTAESTWTLRAIRDSATISETITVVPEGNYYGEWRSLHPLVGHKYTDSAGRTEYDVDYVYNSSGRQSDNYPRLYNGKFQCTSVPERTCTRGACQISPQPCNSFAGNRDQNGTPFNFMNRASYNEARNEIAIGKSIVLTTRQGSNVISTLNAFEHYADLPPCVDADYALYQMSIASLPGARLTPPYACGTEKKTCVDYAPICEGQNLQTALDRPPAFFGPWCTLVGVKARYVECNGKADGDIKWKEAGTYGSSALNTILLQVAATVAGGLILAQLFPPEIEEVWRLKELSPRLAGPDFLKCPPGKCGWIDTPIPEQSAKLILGIGEANPQKLILGIGEANPQGGGKTIVNQIIERVMVKEANPETGRGWTRVCPTCEDVFSNAGQLTLKHARRIQEACSKNAAFWECVDNAAKNVPRVNWRDATVSPPDGY